MQDQRFDKVRVQSACDTFEESFGGPPSTGNNRNLAATDWNKFLWDKKYISIEIDGMNARTPGIDF